MGVLGQGIRPFSHATAPLGQTVTHVLNLGCHLCLEPIPGAIRSQGVTRELGAAEPQPNSIQGFHRHKKAHECTSRRSALWPAGEKHVFHFSWLFVPFRGQPESDFVTAREGFALQQHKALVMTTEGSSGCYLAACR
jgi:hypothetical protein